MLFNSFKKIIDESIPRELLNLYKKSVISQTGAQNIKFMNQDSNLSGFVKPGRRPYYNYYSDDDHYATSSIRRKGGHTIPYYDYGKATYKVLTPQEAKRLIKNDKNEARNLRIDLDGDLILFEVRDNGSIYAIVKNPSKSVTINGVTKRNAGYFSINAILDAADKIWWTDEFNYPLIGSDKFNSRKDNDVVDTYGSISDNSEIPSYRPLDRFDSNIKYVERIPDTGNHDLLKRIENLNSVGAVRYLEDYIEAKKYRDACFETFSRIRKALNKLVRDKDDYEDDEYEARKNKLESRLKLAEDRLKAASKVLRDKELKVLKNTDEYSAKFNSDVREYLAKVQDALYTLNDLKTKLNTEIGSTVKSYIDKSTDYKHSSAYLEASRNAKYLLEIINTELEELSQVEDTLKAYKEGSWDKSLIDSAQNDIDALINTIDRDLSVLSDEKKKIIDKHIEKIDYIKSEYDKVMDNYNKLKPISAKQAADKKAKSGLRTSLDPDLEQSGLIIFTNSDDDND